MKLSQFAPIIGIVVPLAHHQHITLGEYVFPWSGGPFRWSYIPPSIPPGWISVNTVVQASLCLLQYASTVGNVQDT